MSRRRLMAASAMLLGIGFWQLSEAGWIHAKAWLAYALIDRAWEKTLDTDSNVQPWPHADFWPVARLRFPLQQRELVVLSDASDRTLAFGPGHIPESVRPGYDGHTVIAGHRDTHFAVLSDLRVEDPIEMQTGDGRWRRYRMVGRERLRPETPDSLVVYDLPGLTLVTCDEPALGGGQRDGWRFMQFLLL